MGNVRVSFIDVGKGDCILIQAGEQAALIDTGYANTSDKVMAYLRGNGVGSLECLVITHYDRDHIGGVRTIGEKLPVGMVYLPGYRGADKNYRSLMATVEELGLNAQPVVEELCVQLGEALLTIFPSRVEFVPNAKGDEGNDNDLSLVSSLTCGGDSFLFTGDLEKEGIMSYLDGGHGRFDILKVPCHGQKSPCTDELLEDVRPKMAVITDGADNPADKKTLKQLKETGIETYRTGDHGTVVVAGNGAGSYSVSTSRSR